MGKNSKLKNMSYPELIARRKELKDKYMDVRFQCIVGHVDNPLQKRTIRREIATINTFIAQKEKSGVTLN